VQLDEEFVTTVSTRVDVAYLQGEELPNTLARPSCEKTITSRIEQKAPNIGPIRVREMQNIGHPVKL
jgi:hypothetical protein